MEFFLLWLPPVNKNEEKEIEELKRKLWGNAAHLAQRPVHDKKEDLIDSPEDWFVWMVD